jgi:hypothetical protein
MLLKILLLWAGVRWRRRSRKLVARRPGKLVKSVGFISHLSTPCNPYLSPLLPFLSTCDRCSVTARPPARACARVCPPPHYLPILLVIFFPLCTSSVTNSLPAISYGTTLSNGWVFIWTLSNHLGTMEWYQPSEPTRFANSSARGSALHGISSTIVQRPLARRLVPACTRISLFFPCPYQQRYVR